MKKFKVTLFALLAFALTFGAGCEVIGEENSSPAGSSSEQSSISSETPETPEDDGGGEVDDELTKEITIARALELCGEPGNITEDRYYIRGIVQTISNPQYGKMIIKDDTGSIEVYGTYSADGSLTYAQMTEKPVKGDEVLLHCILQNYNGTKEVKNARLIEFKSNAGNYDESDYTEMSIAEARLEDEGELIKVDGVVAQITYSYGMNPSGVMLVDETQSIYVYDGDLAGQVAVGNEVTILASKTYWILEDEQASADKHGYKGCNQLENVMLVSNDKGNNEFDKTWIEENTVKDIVENPVENDITTTIYKVNALVEKREGQGFVNYYIFDLDGDTGSYAYTQCSGSDFAWMDEFNGKICTVYLTALNAKSTATACIYRFLPIAIEDEGFVFDVNDAPQFALDYYAIDQFQTLYHADPELELISSVDSDLLNFENVTISYASNNESVISFETVEDQVVMHCNGATGSANVTITATLAGNVTATETITITYIDPDEYDYISVADAIASPIDTEITVKGIVGPSVVNKNGFYLFGEDGSMIAVLVNDTAQFSGLEIGHEVILKGMRERYIKDDAKTMAGQTSIVNAEILVNLYGKHEYSTAKFVTDKTLADFRELDVTVDYSTTVFVVKATVSVVETAYYTSIKLTSGATEVTLYCSGAGQYQWLVDNFANQEVTLELAACNWNDKTFWASCALAVRTDDGKILNTLNFDTY